MERLGHEISRSGGNRNTDPVSFTDRSILVPEYFIECNLVSLGVVSDIKRFTAVASIRAWLRYRAWCEIIRDSRSRRGGRIPSCGEGRWNRKTQACGVLTNSTALLNNQPWLVEVLCRKTYRSTSITKVQEKIYNIWLSLYFLQKVNISMFGLDTYNQ